MSLNRLLKLRKKLNRKRPKFLREEHWRYKRLGKKWRRPKGIDSAMRHKRRGKPKVVEVGYRNPRKVRGLHPSGLNVVHVYNPSMLDEVDPETSAVMIGRTVGRRKRLQIIDRAEELGIRVLNSGVTMAIPESEEYEVEGEEEYVLEDEDYDFDEDEDVVLLDDEEEDSSKE